MIREMSLSQVHIQLNELLEIWMGGSMMREGYVLINNLNKILRSSQYRVVFPFVGKGWFNDNEN